MKGNVAETRRDGKVKSPVVTPFKPMEKIRTTSTACTVKTPFSIERDTVSTPTSLTSVENRHDRTAQRRLTSESILASPTKSTLMKSNDKCTSPARLAESKRSLISSNNKLDSREMNTVRLSLDANSPRSKSPSRKEIICLASPNQDVRHILRTTNLIVAPQVSPLKLKVKNKSSSTLGLQSASTCHSPVSTRSSPRCRGKLAVETTEPVIERSLSYQDPYKTMDEVEYEWDHISKNFLVSPRK